ncbi:hypothetical protein [Wolbachia endosymbiont (group A) of Ischnus inquisitorius]|uniref:hypothetical protein n=1 Tax=Wolbachia endosymbiont (group A) of Ischnus inquisitorius TaxID=3077922 RepID=UPI003132FE4F
MPNTRETVSALVSAFNVHNYARNTVETNFTLQSRGKKDYIVVSFDKSMGTYQCRRYLDSIKGKIIREFYGIEKGNKAEILDTAKLIFDVNSFPFENYKDVESFPLKNYKGDWFVDKQGSIKFVTPVDDGVIFNLKSHLASSLKKDVLEDMQISSTTVPFNKGKYLCCSKFDNEELSQQFKSKFLSRMRERYENVPKKPLEVKVKDNSVYIKDVFDDARFIDSVTRYKAWLTGMDLGVGNDVDHSVKSFKNMIIRSTYSVTKVMIDGFILAPPLNERVVSILTPITQNGKGIKLLTKEEVRAINRAFNNAVLDDISGRTQAKLSTNGSSEVYGIDFSNPYISHCVITKIIKNSVINKDHELSIDPELRFRALSRSPSTELLDMKLESPTRSPDGALKDSPRQWSGTETEKEELLYNPVNLAGTSKASTQMSYPTAWNDSINLGVSEDSLKDTENICNEEPEKQQVTDKSDRKSSDEYSEAKSQDSKSPKKHGGGLFCKEGPLAKSSPLKRRSVERDTMCSSKSDLVYHVTEKSSVSKPFFSFPTRIKAKSNPSSKVISPVSSLDGDPGPSQGTISGKGEVLPVEYRSDNSSSKTAVDRDSAFCSTGSPAAQHKGSVSSELKHPQQVKHTSEALGKEI